MFGKKKQNFDGLSVYTAFHHVNGLPVAENFLCEVFSYPNRIEFKAGTTNIKLARGKITDICLKSDIEIQNQAVSSVKQQFRNSNRTVRQKMKPPVLQHRRLPQPKNQDEVIFLGLHFYYITSPLKSQ